MFYFLLSKPFASIFLSFCAYGTFNKISDGSEAGEHGSLILNFSLTRRRLLILVLNFSSGFFGLVNYKQIIVYK